MNFAYNSVFFLLFISFKHLQFSFLRIHQINMVFLLRYRTGIGQLIFDFSPLKVFWSNWLFSINKPEIISFLGVFAFSVSFLPQTIHEVDYEDELDVMVICSTMHQSDSLCGKVGFYDNATGHHLTSFNLDEPWCDVSCILEKLDYMQAENVQSYLLTFILKNCWSEMFTHRY